MLLLWYLEVNFQRPRPGDADSGVRFSWDALEGCTVYISALRFAMNPSQDMSIQYPLVELDGVCNCLAMRKAARYLTAAYDKALAPILLRSTQFTILHKVARLGPIGVKQLAVGMAMDRTTMATNLKPLERDGLIKLSIDTLDRRARAIEITPEGRSRLAKAIPLWKQAQDDFEHRFGTSEATKMRALLTGVLSTGLDPWAE